MYRFSSATPLLAVALIAGLLILNCPDFSRAQENKTQGAQGTVNSGLNYEVAVEGAPSDNIEEIILAVSDAVALKDRPPPSVRMLSRRAGGDLEKISNAMDSLGYFKAEVEFEIRRDKQPVEVVFKISPGPRFTLDKAMVLPAGSGDTDILPTAEEAGLAPGEPYSAKNIVDAQKKIIDMIGRRGRPFPIVTDRRVVADFDSDSVSVEFTIDPGPRAEFGETTIKGLETVDRDYARALVPWRAGAEYDASLIDRARQQFFNSGLFSMVDISHPSELTGERLPLEIEVAERNHRTASAGIEYNTNYGPGLRLGWEHRNFFGSGETLSAELSLNALKKSLNTSLRKPRFFGPNRELVVSAAVADERTEAYSSRSLDVSGIIEREFPEIATFGYGLGYRYSRTDDKDTDETETFGHAYVPLNAVRDRRDDILNPTRGYKAGIMLTPYFDTLGSGSNFLKYRLNGNWYHDFSDNGKVVLATRALYGAITGARRDQVPADLRYYAGGGGTVRGYAYQTAGPLDDEDEPIGGKSMLVGSMEMRFRVSEKVGVSPFIDGGRAYEDGHPDLEEELFWGAGIGVQYYTGFGPVRVDVAVPLNRRDEVDEPFQLYVSLGHTF